MQVDGAKGAAHREPVPLGQAIRRVRGDVDQRVVAEAVGRDQGTISKWERGQASPTLEQILSIERALGVLAGSILRLAGYVDDPVNARQAIEADRSIPDEFKPTVLRIYDALATIPATDPSPSGSKRARTAKTRPSA